MNIEVKSEDLFKISMKLLDIYTIENNIYYITLLSYLTVKEYSRTVHRLDRNAKIDLSIQYLPDLIKGLQENGIIDNQEELIKKMEEKDLRNIIDIYHMIQYSHTKEKKKNCCLT